MFYLRDSQTCHRCPVCNVLHREVPALTCQHNLFAHDFCKFFYSKTVKTLRLGIKINEFILFCSQLFVTLQEFLAFLCIKAVWRIEDFLGSCLGKRQSRATIWRPYSIPHSAINCIRSSYARLLPTGRKKEHPTLGQQPFYDPMSNAKVHRIYEATKLLRDFSLILLWFHDFVLPLHT